MSEGGHRVTLTRAEFAREMKNLEGCTVELAAVDEEGLIHLTLSDGVTLYKVWTPILDHDTLGTVPLGIERYDDCAGLCDPTILELQEVAT